MRSWDASVCVSTSTRSFARRPTSAPPPPPPRTPNYCEYDDAGTTTADHEVVPDEDEYLTPVENEYLKPVEEGYGLYAEASEPQGTEGNTGYLEIFDNYQDYDN